MSHSDIRDLIPLYALDALEEPEAAEVDRHLKDCEDCRQLLSESYQVTSLMADDGPAPSHVWQRIDYQISDLEKSEIVDLATRRKQRRWMSIALAAATAAVVFAGVTIMQQSIEGDEALVALAGGVADNQGSVVADFVVDDASVAQVVLGVDGVGYVIPTDSLAPLDSDRTYQLWVITPDEKVISAGVLGATPGPSTFTWKGDVAGFALTREVAGGVVSSDGDVVSLITDI